ncbi:MAG: hypothetical protein M3389_03295 [Actinomycetota bacterium]|nr:hypothetical protein [Actinomycetota bacterium]
MDVLSEQLAQTLSAGDFTLVVAAPQIPVSIQRVLEYLNARGQRFFGLEVSYFRGPVECFVPRLVVKPLISDPASEAGRAPPLDEDAFLEQVPERVRGAAAAFLASTVDAGADVIWRTYGPSVTVTRSQQRQVAWLESKWLGITLKATADFPHEPFDVARSKLAEGGVGTETKDGWYRRVSLVETSDAQLAEAFDVARRLVADVAPVIELQPVEPPLELRITRNDHNVWARHVPALDGFLGRQLRARLVDPTGGAEARVHLVPLAGGQPGWRPRFIPHSAKEELWSSEANGRSFQLVVDGSSR